MEDDEYDDDEEEVGEEEEEDALEESWNLLELSRLCFEKQLENNANDFTAKRNLVDVFCLEAQVLAEQDLFEDAIKEYEKSLQFIPEDDYRKISEIKCQCADYSIFLGNVKQALHFYKEAKTSLQELVKETNDEADEEILLDLNQRIEEIENNPDKYTQQPSLNNTFKDLKEEEFQNQQSNEEKSVNILSIRR